MFQKSSQLNDEEQNNMVFSHQNISSLQLSVNSENVPREAYEIDYNTATKSVGRVYHDFEMYKNAFNDSNSGSLVNETDFSSGLYNIYHFNLSEVNPAALHGDAADLTLKGRRTGNDAIYVYAVVCGEREAVVSGFGSQLRMELM
jgi:phosphoheptose isomerase